MLVQASRRSALWWIRQVPRAGGESDKRRVHPRVSPPVMAAGWLAGQSWRVPGWDALRWLPSLESPGVASEGVDLLPTSERARVDIGPRADVAVGQIAFDLDPAGPLR